MANLKGFTTTRDSTFQVQISVKGQNHYVGTFRNQIQAARAYDLAARKLLGTDAKLNFPYKQNDPKNGSYFTTDKEKRVFSPTIVDSSKIELTQEKDNRFIPITD